MGEFRLQVRVPEELHSRLLRQAASEGISSSELVRRALLDRFEDRSTKAFARLVADEVVFRLEGVLEERANPSSEETPQVVFDRSCLDADLHFAGRVCSSCGGSVHSLRP